MAQVIFGLKIDEDKAGPLHGKRKNKFNFDQFDQIGATHKRKSQTITQFRVSFVIIDRQIGDANILIKIWFSTLLIQAVCLWP